MSDNIRAEYEELRRRFSQNGVESLKNGSWFSDVVAWTLRTHAKNVNADYIRTKYPGAGPKNQAEKLISQTARHTSLIGGIAAGAVTGLELGGAVVGPLAIPGVAACVIADLTMSTRAQLRATYDLSVLWRAPLDAEDPEDCYLIFMSALGVRIAQAAGEFARAVGPKVVAFNVRRLLRAGLRQALIEIIKKIAGTEVAKKLTERALMRLLVPGVSVPISAGASYYFTRSMLRVANVHMQRRGAVVQPLIRLHMAAPELAADAAVQALLVVMEAPGREGWEEHQVEALRHSQSVLGLSDEDLTRLNDVFDARSAREELSFFTLSDAASSALRQYLITAAALGVEQHDVAYSKAISHIIRTTVPPSEIDIRRGQLPGL